MELLKSWFYPVLAVVGVILLAVAVFFSYQAASFSIGVVDIQKVMTDSQIGKQYQQEINAKRSEIAARAQQAQQAKDQAKLAQLNVEFSAYVKDKEDAFSKIMDKKINEIAAKQHLKAVFPSNFVRYANHSVDVTTDVIDAME